MTDKEMPVPFFSTEDQQIEGGKALASAGDTTVGSVEGAIVTGELIWDTEILRVQYMKKEGDLFYHIFRGSKVPDRFWGTGEFGSHVLPAVKACWPMDKHLAEFHAESLRDDAELDQYDEQGNLVKRAENPPHFFGAYFVCIPAIDNRPVTPDEERIKRLAVILDTALKESLARWQDESGGS